MSDFSLLLICLKCHEGVVKNPSSLVERLNGTNIYAEWQNFFPFLHTPETATTEGKEYEAFFQQKKGRKKNPKIFH